MEQTSTLRGLSEVLAMLIAMLAAHGVITSAEVLMLAAIAERHTKHGGDSFNSGRKL